MSDDWEARALKAEKALKRRNGEFYKIVDGLERCHEEILDLEAKLAAAEKERDEAIKSAQSASFNNAMTAGEGLVVAAKLKALQDAVELVVLKAPLPSGTMAELRWMHDLSQALAASKEDNHE